MSVQGGVARDSQQDLVQALDSGLLSEAIAKQGQAILTRMQTPLRLSILGQPGSGKSTLMNLLLGTDVFDGNIRLPTISVTYGENARAVCTLPSGESQTVDSDDLNAVAALNPVFVEMELPLAALRKLSMMEVVTSSDPTEQQRAVAWAAKRTDIALWCTQECSEHEEKMWSGLPDRVQDHSFLVLTKADALGAEGRLAGLVKDANAIGASYFRKILPLATTVALSARKSDGSVDKATLKSSGGIALISAILREVDAGQRAAADAADIFLSQIDFDPTALAPAEMADEAAEIVPVVKDIPALKPVETPKVEQVEEKPQAVQVETVPAVVAAEESVAETPMSSQARALCTQIVEQLAAEGAALADQMETGEIETAAVIDVSVDTVTWLADYLGDTEAASEPAMARTLATATDAADLIQLIQLEKGDSVALDALSLMIQLRHEIQSELAA